MGNVGFVGPFSDLYERWVPRGVVRFWGAFNSSDPFKSFTGVGFVGPFSLFVEPWIRRAFFGFLGSLYS